MTTLQHIARFFPFLRWPRPTRASLQQDLWAGLSVGLVLVPQALAYATLAGMPPHTGLYAAIVPAIIGILWGSSALLAVGPVALTSILVFGSLSGMAQPGSAEWVALAIWLAIYSGIIQFLLGAFHTGKIAYLVSQPVVSGFMNAAAVIIILSQVPPLLGLDPSSGIGAMLEDMAAPSTAQILTTAFGISTLALLLLLKRMLPKLPGVLIVTILGTVASWLIDYAGRGGQIVGALPQGLPALSLPPAISFENHRALLPAALILAIISFTEAMSSCRVLARKRNEAWDENQELIGQGLAKISAGFCSAFPVSGSISRSALNLYAGATSTWASLVSTLCVVLSLLFLTDYIYFLPYTVLAAMIIVPVINLIDFFSFRRLLCISKDDGVVALVTFIVTLASTPRLHFGVFAGVGLTMVFFLYRRTHPRVIEVAEHPDGTLRDRERFGLPPVAPDLLIVRIDSALNFLTGATLERFINKSRASHPEVRAILLASSAINDIDATGVEMLESLLSSLRSDGVVLYMSAVKKQVWDVLERADLTDKIGRERFFGTDREAIAAMKAHPVDRQMTTHA